MYSKNKIVDYGKEIEMIEGILDEMRKTKEQMIDSFNVQIFHMDSYIEQIGDIMDEIVKSKLEDADDETEDDADADTMLNVTLKAGEAIKINVKADGETDGDDEDYCDDCDDKNDKSISSCKEKDDEYPDDPDHYTKIEFRIHLSNYASKLAETMSDEPLTIVKRLYQIFKDKVDGYDNSHIMKDCIEATKNAIRMVERQLEFDDYE